MDLFLTPSFFKNMHVLGIGANDKVYSPWICQVKQNLERLKFCTTKKNCVNLSIEYADKTN
jgi:hypothetical protein